MFPFIGIMADQEPKRAFTPSGSYSMGLFESGDSVDVTADITGTSDFTFMIWAYPTTANQYIFKTSDNTAYLQVKSDGKLRFQILNTNLTNSVVESASAISLNTMQMITVTGNTTNGLKLYINDVLNNSSSMPANNNVAGKTWQLGTNYDGSLALFRSWSKELALADVEAHYAYDENLLLQGGVAVSAMTTDQKTSLEFAIEMIQDVPYDSDEFDDRSTNKYAVTNNGVTLFGQSLQVYTDASDLPNTSTIYSANLAYFNSGSYLTTPTDINVGNIYTVSTWVRINSTPSDYKNVYDMNFNTGDANTGPRLEVGADSSMLIYWRDTNGGAPNNINLGSFTNGTWYHVVFTCNNGSCTAYRNGIQITTGSSPNGFPTAFLQPTFGIGFNSTRAIEDSNIVFPRVFNSELSSSDVSTLYNNGTPLCYNNVPTSITQNCLYAPRLSNWNGNNGDELVDQSPSGITLNVVGSVPFTGTGLNVECSS